MWAALSRQLQASEAPEIGSYLSQISQTNLQETKLRGSSWATQQNSKADWPRLNVSSSYTLLSTQLCCKLVLGQSWGGGTQEGEKQQLSSCFWRVQENNTKHKITNTSIPFTKCFTTYQILYNAVPIWTLLGLSEEVEYYSFHFTSEVSHTASREHSLDLNPSLCYSKWVSVPWTHIIGCNRWELGYDLLRGTWR